MLNGLDRRDPEAFRRAVVGDELIAAGAFVSTVASVVSLADLAKNRSGPRPERTLNSGHLPSLRTSTAPVGEPTGREHALAPRTAAADARRGTFRTGPDTPTGVVATVAVHSGRHGDVDGGTHRRHPGRKDGRGVPREDPRHDSRCRHPHHDRQGPVGHRRTPTPGRHLPANCTARPTDDQQTELPQRQRRRRGPLRSVPDHLHDVVIEDRAKRHASAGHRMGRSRSRIASSHPGGEAWADRSGRWMRAAGRSLLSRTT